MRDFAFTRRSLLVGAAGLGIAATMPAFAMPSPQEVAGSGVPALGNPDGDVTIVEVIDYQCGYCKLCYFEIARLVAEDSGVRVVLKDWPVFGPASDFAARAMLSLRDDARAFHAGADALMRNEGRLSPRRVAGLLEEAGVDVSTLQERMEAQRAEIDAILLRNNSHAVEFGLRGTPAVLVGSRLFKRAMPLEDLRAAVAAARQAPADSDS